MNLLKTGTCELPDSVAQEFMLGSIRERMFTFRREDGETVDVPVRWQKMEKKSGNNCVISCKLQVNGEEHPIVFSFYAGRIGLTEPVTMNYVIEVQLRLNLDDVPGLTSTAN